MHGRSWKWLQVHPRWERPPRMRRNYHRLLWCSWNSYPLYRVPRPHHNIVLANTGHSIWWQRPRKWREWESLWQGTWDGSTNLGQRRNPCWCVAHSRWSILVKKKKIETKDQFIWPVCIPSYSLGLTTFITTMSSCHLWDTLWIKYNYWPDFISAS